MSYQNKFQELLCDAAKKAPNWGVFNEGYAQVLNAVNQGGTFNLFGLTITTPPGVYPARPGSSTEFTVRNWGAAGLTQNPGRLLEVGCGAGGISLYARRDGWHVTATDIDPNAVAATKANADLNVLGVTVIESDLFNQIGSSRFDAIVFNLPLFHKESVSQAEIALSDSNGSLAKRFFDQAHLHLNPGGKIVFMFSNCSDAALLERDDWEFQLVAADYDSVGAYWRSLVVGTPR